MLSLVPFLGFAQKIDWNNFDFDTYNKALTQEITKVRTNALAPKYDTNLMKAAEYHGYYVSLNNLITHADTTSDISSSHTDRIRMFIPHVDVVEYYTNCVIDSTSQFNNSYSSEIVCSFPLPNKSMTYQELAASALEVYKTSASHWNIVTYKSNGCQTSAHERLAGFIGVVNGRVYSVIVFYDDHCYDENLKCFNSFSKQMSNGIHDDAYEYVVDNNVKAKTSSVVKTLKIGGETIEVNVSVGYIDHIDNGLKSSKVISNIQRELKRRKIEYNKKAGL